MNDQLMPKSSKDEVVQQIFSDLDIAIQYLPDVAYTDGHVVKGTALLLKAKVLLFNQKFQDAATIAQQIISSDKFHIYPDYQRIFETAGQGTDNTEIMFSVLYTSPNFENNSAIRWAGGIACFHFRIW